MYFTFFLTTQPCGVQGAASSVAHQGRPSWHGGDRVGADLQEEAADSDDATRKRVLRSHTSGGPSQSAFEVRASGHTCCTREVLMGRQALPGRYHGNLQGPCLPSTHAISGRHCQQIWRCCMQQGQVTLLGQAVAGGLRLQTCKPAREVVECLLVTMRPCPPDQLYSAS